MSKKVRKRPCFSTKGSVVRISMTNFMTYRNETVYPGPNFNVTVGPNGSGKSSIVTALSICLGGDLKTLNRQVDMQSLINNDCGNQAAVIEIELFYPEGKNKVVKCTLTRGNAQEPKWHIDGKAVTKEKLLSFTENLQIQPGNLCQFLPQDVVREFPQMKPPQIFENTIKAVGDTEMLEKLYQGARIQEEIGEIDSSLKTKANTLASLEQKEKKHDDLMRRIKEQEDLEYKKDVVEKCLAWERFSMVRRETKETRAKRDVLEKRKKELEQELEKIRDFRKEYQTKVDTIKDNIDKSERQIKEVGCDIEKFDISSLEEEIERLDFKEKELDQDRIRSIQEKKKLKAEIEKLKDYLNNNAMTEEEKRNSENWNKLKLGRMDQLEIFKTKIEELNNQNLANKREIDRCRLEYQNLMNRKSQKLNMLQRESPDTYNAVLWLRQNKKRFKGEVHEPIMLLLEIKEENFSKYIELSIGRADLEAFVCEEAEDMNLLLSELREKAGFRRVNAVCSKPNHSEAFRKPFDADNLKKYGFLGFLSDAFEAPDAVHSYLCQQKNLHEVPVFEKEIPDVTDDLKTKFRNYYIGDMMVTVKKSKYSGEYSTGMEDTSTKRAIRLQNSVDQALLTEVENKMQEKEQNFKDNESRIRQKKQSQQKVQEDLQKLQANLKQLEEKQKEFRRKENELKLKEHMLHNKQAQPQENTDEEKRKIKEEKLKFVKQLCEQVKGCQPLIAKSCKIDLMRSAYILQLNNVEGENQDSNYQLSELEREHKEVEKEYKTENDKFDAMRPQIQSLHVAAREATGGYQDEGTKYKAPLEWQNTFKKMELKNDVNILQAKIEDYESRIKQIAVKPEARNRMEEVKKSLERAKKEHEDLENKKSSKIKALEDLRRDWIHGVKSLVQDVNQKFGYMMDKLNYAGSVELQEGSENDALDMKNYGIKILVKFRSGEDFDELSRGTQSGGEKSVTTAVYMMALQGITQVPFRCVDEINQGMDENNERKVWDMLLDVCREHQAQYFYMAPKFPYNLPFDEQVTLLICNSGRVKRKEDKNVYETENFFQIMKKLKKKK